MSQEEKNQIMLDFSRTNSSINEPMEKINQSSKQQTSLRGNDASDMLLTGSFLGVGNGTHDAQGNAKVIPLENGGDILRLEDLIVTNGPDLYVYLTTDKSERLCEFGKIKG
jgi:hypothetical protein